MSGRKPNHSFLSFGKKKVIWAKIDFGRKQVRPTIIYNYYINAYKLKT